MPSSLLVDDDIVRISSTALALAFSGVVLGACGGSASGTSSSSPPPAARFVLGRWHGELQQRGLAPFQVAVTVGSLSSSAANRVRYSGLGCGGHWTYLGTSGATVRFREDIDSGRSSKCKGTGLITLNREGPRLHYKFSGGGVVSLGVLSRG